MSERGRGGEQCEVSRSVVVAAGGDDTMTHNVMAVVVSCVLARRVSARAR